MENFYLFIGVVIMFIKCNIFIKICQIAYLKYVLSLYTNYISNFYKVLVKSILMGGLWENLKVGNQWECCRHSLGGASHGLNWGRRGNRGGTGLTKEQGWLWEGRWKEREDSGWLLAGVNDMGHWDRNSERRYELGGRRNELRCGNTEFVMQMFWGLLNMWI